MDPRTECPSVDTMLAVRYPPAGRAGVFSVVAIARPEPGIGEVLVRVHAAGITMAGPAGDWSRSAVTERWSTRYPPVCDIAGTIIAFGAGDGEGRFVVGEEVFGVIDADGFTAVAEYVVVAATSLARRPRTLSFVESAALPVAAVSAWNVVIEIGDLQPEQTVLIRDAATPLGLCATQIAAMVGAEVIATDSGRSWHLLRELGATHVVTSVARTFPEADLVIDASTVVGVSRIRLSADGPNVSAHGPRRWDPSVTGTQIMRGFRTSTLEPRLVVIAGLADTRGLRPIIKRAFPIEAIEEAFINATSAPEPGTTVLVL